MTTYFFIACTVEASNFGYRVSSRFWLRHHCPDIVGSGDFKLAWEANMKYVLVSTQFSCNNCLIDMEGDK